MKRGIKIGLFVAFLMNAAIILFGYSGCLSKAESKDKSAEKCSLVSRHSVLYRDNMRKLWEDHIIWTRNVIMCSVDNFPGADEAVKRLLQNQVDIGNSIKPYYGVEAGDKLTKLLKTHVVIATDVFDACKTANMLALDIVSRKWYANADEIAEFLNKANPDLALADMKMMMYNHLKLTNEEAVLRISKDYKGDVAGYDKVHTEILKMSDQIADGIIKQFPEKFETLATDIASK